MSQRKSNASKAVEFERAWAEFVPQLGFALLGHEPEVYRLVVRCRNYGDWVVVANKDGEDGTPLVAFGTGYDVVSALAGLNGAITAGRWKVDKPWEPG